MINDIIATIAIMILVFDLFAMSIYTFWDISRMIRITRKLKADSNETDENKEDVKSCR